MLGVECFLIMLTCPVPRNMQLCACLCVAGVHGRVMGEGPDGVDIPLAATLMIQHIQHNSSSSARFGDYYKYVLPCCVSHVVPWNDVQSAP